MKKMTLFAVLLVLFIILIDSPVQAWHVKIINSTSEVLQITVCGDHLFWEEAHCTKTIQPQDSATCEMPAGICPCTVRDADRGGRSISGTRFARCWNSEFLIYHDQANTNQRYATKWDGIAVGEMQYGW